MDSMNLVCRRCDLPVVVSAEYYETFERMHYVCFHYEFEHRSDPDSECSAGGCPAAGTRLSSRLARTGGADIVQAGNTVVPAILALEATGLDVRQSGDLFVATARNARFAAEDPVAVLGLVRLAELRQPWGASDAEIDDVLSRFEL